MSVFIQGQDRSQATLFPERLDDYTGRPAYHLSTMLKLFVYGYLNRAHSSHRLERNKIEASDIIWKWAACGRAGID